LTQYRSADIHDVHADMLGICLGSFFVLIFIILRKNRT
jgi:VanZ family protein